MTKLVSLKVRSESVKLENQTREFYGGKKKKGGFGQEDYKPQIPVRGGGACQREWAGHWKAEDRGLQDFLFERQRVGGTCAGWAAVVAFWSFVSGGGVARAVTCGARAERDVGDASPSTQLSGVRGALARPGIGCWEASTRRPLVAGSTERGPGRAGRGWGGSGGEGRRRRARASGRTQRRRRQSPKRSCEASLFPLPWASRGGHPGREPLRNRSPSPTALRTLGPILAFLLRLLHLGLDSGCCGEDVPPPGRGKKEEKMKKYRRALALVSCLSLCSLVWWVRGRPLGTSRGDERGSRSGHTPKSSRLFGLLGAPAPKPGTQRPPSSSSCGLRVVFWNLQSSSRERRGYWGSLFAFVLGYPITAVRAVWVVFRKLVSELLSFPVSSFAFVMR